MRCRGRGRAILESDYRILAQRTADLTSETRQPDSDFSFLLTFSLEIIIGSQEFAKIVERGPKTIYLVSSKSNSYITTEYKNQEVDTGTIVLYVSEILSYAIFV